MHVYISEMLLESNLKFGRGRLPTSLELDPEEKVLVGARSSLLSPRLKVGKGVSLSDGQSKSASSLPLKWNWTCEMNTATIEFFCHSR